MLIHIGSSLPSPPLSARVFLCLLGFASDACSIASLAPSASSSASSSASPVSRAGTLRVSVFPARLRLAS